MPSNRLFNVPQPEPFEAASCWLTRLALSQGVSPQEIIKFLGLPNVRQFDFDRGLHGERMAELRKVCGLPDIALSVHERIIVSLNTLSGDVDSYLIRTRQKKPQFRYCPICIKNMRTPHFPIHWRFIAWRWCPEHNCLLEELCQHCGETIKFPIDITASKAGRMGYAFLNRCQVCGKSLSAIEPCFLQSGAVRGISELEKLVLAQGRAFISSLYYGRFKIKGEAGWKRLDGLPDVANLKAFQVPLTYLNPDSVRARICPDPIPTVSVSEA